MRKNAVQHLGLSTFFQSTRPTYGCNHPFTFSSWGLDLVRSRRNAGIMVHACGAFAFTVWGATQLPPAPQYIHTTALAHSSVTPRVRATLLIEPTHEPTQPTSLKRNPSARDSTHCPPTERHPLGRMRGKYRACPQQ